MRRGLPSTRGATVLADTRHLASVRRCVGSAGGQLLGPERTADVELCVSELVTNAIRHGAGDRLHVDHDVIDGSFVVTVSNDSTVLPLPPTGTVPGNQPEGRGLQIVYAIADGVAVRSEHGTVTVSCRFDP